ncbi:MAG: leucine-rich repeat protein [Bacteroides sp.]|nr:leucine-rich repeat protein [Bacteroides sp.]
MRNPIYDFVKETSGCCMSGCRYFCILIVTVWVGLSGCKGDTSPEMITDIELAEKEFTLGVGSTYQLNVYHYPVDISDPSYGWESTDPEVVSVYGGLITGVSLGEALVIVSIDRLQLRDTCRVTVRDVPVENITIEPASVTLKSGETVTLTPVVEPTPPEGIYFMWESQDEEVARVEDGVVTGLRGGSALITVKTVYSELVGTAVVTVERDEQVRTIHVSEPGTLESLLDPESRITDLTLTGRVDARDLKILSQMDYLYFLDMQQVQIEAVFQQNGYFSENELLPENFRDMRIDRVLLPEQLRSIPARCFAYSSLSSVDFPSSIQYIAEGAFMGTSLLSEVDIPGVITHLPDKLFAESGIEKVGFPSGVTSVGSELFRDCIRLTALDLPAGIRETGDALFKGCTALRSLTLPVEIARIGDETFYGCISLSVVDLPAEVREIGDAAFRGCTALQRIDFPQGILTLGDEVFYGCTGLTSIELPADVEEIGDGIFRGCTSLRSIHLSHKITEIGQEAFYGCSSLSALDLPAGLQEIGHAAFKGCTSLQTITVPAGVEELPSETFSGCTSLAAVRLLASTPPQVALNAFYQVDLENCVLYVPAGSLAEYQEHEVWGEFAQIIPE